MKSVPQMASIAELEQDHLSIFQRLTQGPIIIANRSEPQAVVVSMQEWDELADRMRNMEQRLARLETYVESKRIAAAMKSDPDSITPLTELCRKYNVVKKPAIISMATTN